MRRAVADTVASARAIQDGRMNDAVGLAERLNRECECVGTDVPALQQRLDGTLDAEMHAHLFADLPVFVAKQHAREMQRVVSATASVTALPAFREHVLGSAPAIARVAPRARGVFFGFDFHLTSEGPKLIEINSNAGGALLSIEMQRAQQGCCTQVSDFLRMEPSAEARAQAIVAMFVQEWRLARGDEPLRTIAVVDDAPRGQYLYPEFLLFKSLFEAHGLRALIVDARELTVDAGSLRHDGQHIDLVYNRCTDFYFAEPAHAALAAAYSRDLAVITPHPFAHALYANKDNLILLSSAATLRALGADDADIETLTHAVPRTLKIEDPEQRWWEERKDWFFKPSAGFGSRGTYRGDKITRRAFGDVMGGSYIAQRLTPPSVRRRGAQAGFKLDVRNYVYDAATQLMSARLYQGQTTNFRTPGGGFAPIYQLD
jgi:hypothetical protein